MAGDRTAGRTTFSFFATFPDPRSITTTGGFSSIGSCVSAVRLFHSQMTLRVRGAFHVGLSVPGLNVNSLIMPRRKNLPGCHSGAILLAAVVRRRLIDCNIPSDLAALFE